MTAKELERYILNKPNAKKKTVQDWRYIRYTAYAIAFATLQKTDGGAVLTVFGRRPELEKEHAGVIYAALGTYSEKFTSVKFPNSLPSDTIKSLIDYSYAERMKAVSMPDNASGGSSDFPYIGVNFGDCFSSERQEVAATKEESGASVEEKSCAAMPYRVLTDETAAKNYEKLLKMLKKEQM